MERVFKFIAGDVVRMKESNEKLTALVDGGTKEYREHLTVVFYFWDGYECCYVLNTGDDGICLICPEDSLVLEEGAPMSEEVQENNFLGSVYHINNRLVAADGLEKAIKLFRSHPSHQYETIEAITLQGPDTALIQKGKEE